MVLSMFLGWFWPFFFISLRDINLTLGLLPPRRHVVWRDSVGVESSESGLTSECADIFHQSFLWLLRHTDEPQKGRNSCLWLQSRSVLSSFGVVLMSCRVNFHVLRSALQNLICLLNFLQSPKVLRSLARLFQKTPIPEKTGRCMEVRLNSPCDKFKISNKADDRLDLTPEDIPGASFSEKEIE